MSDLTYMCTCRLTFGKAWRAQTSGTSKTPGKCFLRTCDACYSVGPPQWTWTYLLSSRVAFALEDDLMTTL